MLRCRRLSCVYLMTLEKVPKALNISVVFRMPRHYLSIHETDLKSNCVRAGVEKQQKMLDKYGSKTEQKNFPNQRVGRRIL